MALGGVYQIWPRSFSDSDGDGIGDISGITSRLDHFERLGVDVVWLSPIYRSPHRDFGYDISDYQALDPVFGTLDDFDHLLADVHERGMKLLHRPGGQPHVRPSTRGSSSRARRPSTPSAIGTGGGPLAPASSRAPGAEPTNWTGVLLAADVDARPDDRRVLPPPVHARAARPQLGARPTFAPRSTR